MTFSIKATIRAFVAPDHRINVPAAASGMRAFMSPEHSITPGRSKPSTKPVSFLLLGLERASGDRREVTGCCLLRRPRSAGVLDGRLCSTRPGEGVRETLVDLPRAQV